MSRRTLLLDLDGTLVDSAPDLAASLNRVLAPLDRPFSPVEVAPMIGDGVAALVRRAAAARGLPDNPETLCRFAEDYRSRAAELTRPYPGVREGMQALVAAGWRLAVCTNKPEAATHALLAALGLLPMLAAVGGGDSFGTRKPDPRHMLATLLRAGGGTGEAVAVGDHRNDVLAAAAAGVPCIFAAWGYGDPVTASGAAAVAHEFAEVPALAGGLLAGRL
jgi:phosphoglycolate phosphatase